MKFLASLITLIVLTFCFVVLYGHGPSGFAAHAGEDASDIGKIVSHAAGGIPAGLKAIYEYFVPPPPPPAPPAGPDQLFASLLSQTEVPADQLGQLARDYPELANQVLKNRSLQIRGKVKALIAEGVDGNRVAITLDGQPQKNVIIVSDLLRYFTPGLVSYSRSAKYVILGEELLFTSQTGAVASVQCRLGDTVIINARYLRILPNGVGFDTGLVTPTGH